MTQAIRNKDFSLIVHDDPWREYFSGVECQECEQRVPYGSKVYNEDGTNNYLCVKCY